MANIIVNGHNVGVNLTTLILAIENGPSIPIEHIGHLKEVQSKSDSSPSTATPVIYGGLQLHQNIYHGYSGRIIITRFAGDLTALMNNIMQNSQQTGAETFFTMYMIAQNPTVGNSDEYAFQKCVMNDHDMGNWTAISEVDQAIAFRCQSLTIPNGVNILQSGPTN